MELEAALPPTDIRLNSQIRQYAFRLAKLSALHPINLWYSTRAKDLPTNHKPIQLDRIKDSIQGLVDTSTLEPIKHFYFKL